MFDAIVSLLFHCSHRQISRPFTPSRKLNTPKRDTYVVCLDCGTRFAYDWEKMRKGKQIPSSLPLRPSPPASRPEVGLTAPVIPG